MFQRNRNCNCSTQIFAIHANEIPCDQEFLNKILATKDWKFRIKKFSVSLLIIAGLSKRGSLRDELGKQMVWAVDTVGFYK